MNSEIKQRYMCEDCNWIGSEDELDFDKVESCMGDDKIEICPACWSFNVTRKNDI